MLRNRRRSILLICVVGVLFLLLVPHLLGAQLPPPEPRASALCQMEYGDRTVDGQPAWEVVSITLGPDGGRLGEMSFQPGDVIVEVGGRPVATGASLDLWIRQAVLEQQRTVTMMDPLTGAKVVYTF